MYRFLSRSLRITFDLGVMSIAYWLAWLFRFEFGLPDLVADVALLTWPCVVGVQYAVVVGLGVPRMAWRYVSIRDVIKVVGAVAIATTTLVVLRLVQILPSPPVIPFGVLAMDAVMVFVGLVGTRGTWRVYKEIQDRKRRSVKGDLHRVVLIGAGEAGVMVARELVNRPDLQLKPVGFLDDDPRKAHTYISGLPVLGTTRDAADIARRFNIKRSLITIANAGGSEIRRIAETCRDAGMETKIIPGIYEIVGNKVNLSRVRDVAIEDLLGRAPVKLDEDVVRSSLRSRVVMVTGAGGSIGSELCRQICQFGPEKLILVERFENALFEVHRELTANFPHLAIEPRIADITDVHRVTHIFEQSRPQIVFHAAAHKHVPMMEWNPGEAVKNNVGGTRVVAMLADRYAVERFVLVSTDKAVNPTSVMGATKRVAEMYIQAFASKSATRFVTVRFGNVLGSAGSVIPIFRQQIATGGPVLVTHPEMKRYFMTIPEASQLVMQAGAMGLGGEIFILDMGQPVKIVDLARDLITLSGLKPDVDIDIKFTGIRPGEKLFEELSSDAEQADKTKHPKIFIGRVASPNWSHVVERLDALLDVAGGTDMERVRSVLADTVPEYAHAHPPTRKTNPRGERSLAETAGHPLPTTEDPVRN